MHEQRKSSWDRLLVGSQKHNAREEKALEYVIHRIEHGDHLEDVVQEPYVRRTCSQQEINAVINDPRLVHAARTSMEQTFNSGELDPTKKDIA